MNSKLRTLLAIFLVAVVGFPIILSAEGQKEAAGEEKVQIGFVPATYDLTDYYGQASQALQGVLDDAGIDYEYIDRAPTVEGDVAMQISICEDMIAIGVDYLVIGPSDFLGMVPAIESANEAGIPVLICGYLGPYPEDAGVDVTAYFGEDNYLGGQVTGEYVWEAGYLEEGDKFAMIKAFQGNQKSEDRGSAEDIWIENGAELVYTDYAQWEADKAYTATERILAGYPDVKVIYAINSGAAIGTANALKANNREEIHVFGFGCVTQELDYIWEGGITASGFRDAQASGRDMGNAILKLINGESVEQHYPIDFVMVDTKDDIVEIIPESQLKLMENWPEIQEYMKK